MIFKVYLFNFLPIMPKNTPVCMEGFPFKLTLRGLAALGGLLGCIGA